MNALLRALLPAASVLILSACSSDEPVVDSVFISRLVDNNGKPLAGVTVAINGIKAPARTDSEGRFVLPADFRDE